MTQDEIVGWHHRLDGHEFEQALGDSAGQGSINREAWCAAVAESDIGSHTVRHDLAAEQEKPSFVGQVK